MDLKAAHLSVLRRLTLRREESDRCWLLDHGFDDAGLDELTSGVVSALREHDLASDRDTFWNWHYLPLLVVAVEVGYQYGEDENSFWPRLAERLGAPFHGTHRRVLTRYFEEAVPATGVQPPPVPWAEHFTLIRWPITHAVLPKWQQEPLLELIAQCPVAIDSAGADLGPLAAGASGAPNLALLFADPELAAAVVRAVLDMDATTSLLSPELRARLRRDVRAVPAARRALQRARGRQLRLRGGAPSPRPSPQRTPAQAPARPKRAIPLALRIAADAAEFWIPPFTPTAAVERATDRARVALRGERRRHVLGNVVQFGERWDSAPTLETGEGLVTAFEVEHVTGATEHERIALSMVGISVQAPMVFSPRAGPAGYAGQVLSRAVSSRERIWLLSADRPPAPRREQPLGEVCAFEVDPADAEVVTWLRQHGVSVDDDAVVTGLGSPAFGAPGATLGALLPEDVLALDVAGTSAIVGDHQLDPGLHLVDVAVAEQLGVALAKGRRAIDLPVRVHEPVDEPAPVEADLLGGAPSAASLRARSHALRVVGRWPLAGLMVSARLVAGGRVIARAWTGPLPALPCTIASDDPLWSIADAPGSPDVLGSTRLIFDLGGLGELDVRVDGAPVARSDAPSASASAGRRFATATKPWVLTEVREPAPDDLLLVVDSHDQQRASSWCVAGAAALGPQPTPTPPPRVRRSLQAPGAAPTAVAIGEALHLWAAAVAADPLTDGRRRVVVGALDAWSAEALCGPTWSSAERTALGSRVEAARVIADALLRPGIAFDDDVAHDEPQRRALLAALARGLRGHEAWLQDLARPKSAALDDDALGALSGLIAAAIGDAWIAAGVSAEAPDPPCLDVPTMAALERAAITLKRAREVTDLLDLVFPAAARDRLADLGEWTDGDSLVAEAKRALGARPAGAVLWSEEAVRALATLWTNPAGAAGPSAAELRAPMDDLHGARLVRYLCLRSRARRGDPR